MGNCRYSTKICEGKMYVITGGGRDRQGSPGAEVVVATCQSCG